MFNFEITKHIYKLAKFGLVGILCTILDFIVFSLLIFVFEWNIINSHLTAFSIAVIASYVLNKNYTFSNSIVANSTQTITKYVLLNTIGAIISTIAILFFSPMMFILIAKLFAATLSLLWNYASSYFFIFSPRAQSQKK